MKVKKKLLWTTIVSIGFLLTLGFFTDIAFAEEKPNESIYQRFAYILHISDGWLWQDLLRTIGGGTVFLLAWLNGFLEGIIDKVITLNNFYSSGPMGEFMKVARPVVWGVFFIALFVLGFQFMMNKVEKRNEIILNVVLALCFIVVIPDLMVSMGKVTEVGINQINPEKTKLSSQLIKSNVADLRYYAEKDFEISNKKNGDEYLPPQPMSKEDSRIGTTDFTYGNRLSEKSLPYISFAQKLDISEDGEAEKWGKKLDDNHKFSYEVLSNKLDATGNGDEFEVIELRENQIPLSKLGQESYYRYHVNWGVLIFSLLVTSFAMIITIIKIGRAAFDLAFHQIFGMFVAATDLTGGQRTKKILVEMTNTFGIIFIMTLLLKIFVLYSSWANGLKGSIGGIGVLLLLIAGAWALMDAPDIVARMMGIDAGLKSGYQALMGGYAASKMIGGAGKAVGKGVAGAGKMAMGGTNYGRRMIEGMRTPTLSESMKQAKNNKKDHPTPSLSESMKQEKNNNGETPTPSNAEGGGGVQGGISPSLGSSSGVHGGSRQNSARTGTNRIRTMGGAFPTGPSSLLEKDGWKTTPSGIIIPNTSSSSDTPIISNTQSGGGTQGGLSPSSENSSGVHDASSNQDGGGFSTTPTSSHWGERTAKDGSMLKHGHKEATHPNTMLGGSRTAREFRESITRFGNSGFSGGQIIRTAGLSSSRLAKGTTKMAGKASLQIARAIAHPRATMQVARQRVNTMGANIGTATAKNIARVNTKTRTSISKGIQKSTRTIQHVSSELKRPPGQSWNPTNRKGK